MVTELWVIAAVGAAAGSHVAGANCVVRIHNDCSDNGDGSLLRCAHMRFLF